MPIIRANVGVVLALLLGRQGPIPALSDLPELHTRVGGRDEEGRSHIGASSVSRPVISYKASIRRNMKGAGALVLDTALPHINNTQCTISTATITPTRRATYSCE